MFKISNVSLVLGAALLLCVAGVQAQSTPAPNGSTAAAAPKATHKPPSNPDATHKVPTDSTPAPSGTTNNNPGG